MTILYEMNKKSIMRWRKNHMEKYREISLACQKRHYEWASISGTFRNILFENNVEPYRQKKRYEYLCMAKIFRGILL